MARSFATNLLSRLKVKFSHDNLDVRSPGVLASALDPRFRNLNFLEVEQRIQVQKDLAELASEKLPTCPPSSVTEPAAKKPCLSSLAQLMSTTANVDDGHDEPVDNLEKAERQLAVFFTEEPTGMETDVLAWWKVHSDRFPLLAPVARKFLAIPGSSVPSKSVFSAAGAIVTKTRSSLHPWNVDALIFLRKNVILPSLHRSTRLLSAAEEVAADLIEASAEELAAEPPLPSV